PVGYNLHGLVLLLPYIEQANIYQQWNFKAAAGDYVTAPFSNYGSKLAVPDAVAGGNAALAAIQIPLLLCPSDNGDPMLNTGSSQYQPDAAGKMPAAKTSYEFLANWYGLQY